jgi:hypothetical protein
MLPGGSSWSPKFVYGYCTETVPGAWGWPLASAWYRGWEGGAVPPLSPVRLRGVVLGWAQGRLYLCLYLAGTVLSSMGLYRYMCFAPVHYTLSRKRSAWKNAQNSGSWKFCLERSSSSARTECFHICSEFQKLNHFHLSLPFCFIILVYKSRDSSVGIALGYGLDRRGSGVRFPAGGLGIFL